VAVPVHPNQLIYSYFKNVAGSATPGASVYGLDKLRILDTMIERLRSARAKPSAMRDEPDSSMSDERLDALIQHYGRELHAAVTRSMPYGKPVGVEPGMLVSLAA